MSPVAERPLGDLVVLELASVLAGPSVGQFLAECGARVVKIEHPGRGDVTRSWYTTAEDGTATASYFAACNFGKESVGLNLAAPGSRPLLKALVAQSDILLSSFGPGSAGRLGLDDQTLRDWNPSLIHGAVTGYGDGDARPGYDAVIQAESGFMALNGAEDGQPVKMPVALMDILAAHHLKEELLLALLRRGSSGEGCTIRVSLFDAAVASLANQATGWLATGVPPVRAGSAHPNIAPYGTLVQTSDGVNVLLAVGDDRQFSRLCTVLDAPGLAADDRFRHNRDRVRHRMKLEATLTRMASQIEADRLLPALRDARVPAGAIHSVPQAIRQAERLVLGSPPVQGLRQRIARTSAMEGGSPALRPPPALGADTRTVLTELCSCSDQDLNRLRREGAIT